MQPLTRTKVDFETMRVLHDYAGAYEQMGRQPVGGQELVRSFLVFHLPHASLFKNLQFNREICYQVYDVVSKFPLDTMIGTEGIELVDRRHLSQRMLRGFLGGRTHGVATFSMLDLIKMKPTLVRHIVEARSTKNGMEELLNLLEGTYHVTPDQSGGSFWSEMWLNGDEAVRGALRHVSEVLAGEQRDGLKTGNDLLTCLNRI